MTAFNEKNTKQFTTRAMNISLDVKSNFTNSIKKKKKEVNCYESEFIICLS